MLAALTLLILTASAVDANAERLPIKTYTAADGLARDHVNRIVQDSKGFLWFCTSEGLSRFDGYRFTNYGMEQGLADRQVNDLLETRSKTYWVATNNGLCRFIPDPMLQASESPPRASSGRFVIYYPSEEATARSINVICEDQAGTIWCGTSAGLFRLDQPGGKAVFSFVDIIQPAGAVEKLRVQAIIEDRRGSLWIIAQSGLYRLWPDGIVERFTGREKLPKAFSNALLEDRDGRIWVGSGFGLYELVADPKPGHLAVARVYTLKDGLPSNNISSLRQSSDGKLWVGTDVGLSEFLPAESKDGGRFRSYTQANGLSNTEINTLYEDRDRNLWIGTSTVGAMRLAANGFVTYTKPDGLGGTRVASILEDRRGEVCVITTNGFISRFEHGRFTAVPLTLPKGMYYRGWGWYQITFQDSAGEWWISTGEGLVRYPRLTSLEQITHARPKAIYRIQDGLPANAIFRLFEDSRGDIWISTLDDPKGVLTRWERATETLHRYSPADGIPEASPTAFCEDGSGNLWIGLYKGGLLRYRAGRFTALTTADGVPPGLIRGFYLDHQGRLWIATSEGGVARLDHPDEEHIRVLTYSTADGLSSNQATCVTEDKWGMIYVGTGRGLDKLDPATGHITHYTMADGLANSFVNVGFRGRDGSLWFGTLEGLSRLIPQPERPASPPSILITALRIAGVPYPISELGAASITVPELAANQNNIEIDFSGLNLAAGESLRYQYKLEGPSSQWSVPTEQRTVTYPNLPAGSYRFSVLAQSSDATLSQSPAVASFRILSPIWQRWWFRFLGLTLIALPVAVIARYRFQRLKAKRDAEEALRKAREERLAELEQVRKRIATDLHDDIGSSLTQISILSEVVLQNTTANDSPGGEPLSMIARSARELVDAMSDIVWAINPQKDHVGDLSQRMRRFASDILTARNIPFEFREPDEQDNVPLGANIRREVFLIFKESVNNLVRHSGCTEADIEFQIINRALKLRVRDNGKGFDTLQNSEGQGLSSMRQRADGIGARLEVISGNGEGVTITLELPINKHEPVHLGSYKNS